MTARTCDVIVDLNNCTLIAPWSGNGAIFSPSSRPERDVCARACRACVRACVPSVRPVKIVRAKAVLPFLSIYFFTLYKFLHVLVVWGETSTEYRFAAAENYRAPLPFSFFFFVSFLQKTRRSLKRFIENVPARRAWQTKRRSDNFPHRESPRAETNE